MGNTIVKLFQKDSYVIDEDILKLIKKNNLTIDEAILIVYFYGNKSHPVLDCEQIQNKFSIEEIDSIKAFEGLMKKNLIQIKVEKNKDSKMEEIIDLTPLYQLLALDLNEVNKEEKEKNIYSLFESEFGRPLSSMEYKIISEWLDKNISEELIREALKEATFNGSLTLRYIDGILSEWLRKGFKTAKDINHYIKKKSNSKVYINQDLFDYNWLEDDNG